MKVTLQDINVSQCDVLRSDENTAVCVCVRVCVAMQA